MHRDVKCQSPSRARMTRSQETLFSIAGFIGLSHCCMKRLFWCNGLLCILRMYHYGWLWEDITFLSEMYADVMDVNRCNSAKEFPVPKFCFFDFAGVHRGP